MLISHLFFFFLSNTQTIQLTFDYRQQDTTFTYIIKAGKFCFFVTNEVCL